MFKVNTLGCDNVLLKPKVSSASISSLSALAPTCFRIPIPLVPVIPAVLFAIFPAAAPRLTPAAVVAAFPPSVIPEIVVVPLAPLLPVSYTHLTLPTKRIV